MTVAMIAPAGLGGIVKTRYLNSYTIGADGVIAANQVDVLDLMGLGFTPVIRTGYSANGMGATIVPLVAGKNAAGTILAGSPGAGVFGISLTAGTSEALTGETANSNTKTDIVVFEVVLPQSYVDGQAFSIIVNADIDGAGTPGTKTVDVNLYKAAAAGTQGADLISTAAQNLTTSPADYIFVVDGATLAKGDRIMIVVTVVLQESAGTNINAKVNSVRIS